MEYLVKLKVADPELKDLQYVLDVMVRPEALEQEEEEEEEITSSQSQEGQHHSTNEGDTAGSRIQARFLSPSNNVGCGGTRIHGRGNNDHRGSKLQIVIPLSMVLLDSSSENDNLQEHSVDLVAGWACGHEAVTLTQSIVFRPKKISSLLKTTTATTATTTTTTNTKKRNEKQSQETHNDTDMFGKVKFTANSFLTGLVVFVFVGGTVLNALLALTSSNHTTTTNTTTRSKSDYSTRKTS
jgi:hypothetical protein